MFERAVKKGGERERAATIMSRVITAQEYNVLFRNSIYFPVSWLRDYI